MIFRHSLPPPPLADFVAMLWYCEGIAPAHRRDTIVASRDMGLLVNLAIDELVWYTGENYATRNTLRGIGLGGTQSGHFAIDATQPKVMGVQFKPGGAYPFFGPSAREFGDCHVSLENIWGAEAGRLHQRLVEAPDIDRKFCILGRALVDAAPRAIAHDPAVAFALDRFARAPLTASVGATAKDADISHKRFIRLFTEEVGMAPKLFLRIGRFNRLLGHVSRAPGVHWAEIAADHGYYDQSHFIHDFRDFTGMTPSVYLARRGPDVRHVPLPD
ncbi:MAG: helix-turn-helix domain-containing protein [Rhizomicrobium sp.]|jgi:AraC-like DNA-binding protein